MPGLEADRPSVSRLRGDPDVSGPAAPGCGGSLAALLLALPVLLLLAARMAVRYVRTGQKLPSRGEERVFWALLIYFLAWGVLRNLMA